MNTNKPGYTIILTLIITSTAVFIATYLYVQGYIYVPYTQTMIHKEQAKALAYSGIEIAKSILTLPAQEEQKENQKEGDKKISPEQMQLQRILPVLNRWQIFSLDAKRDGIDGEIKICIMSELGKININAIYDFQKHTFIGAGQKQKNWQAFMQYILGTVEKQMGGSNLLPALEKFLKEQKIPLNDPTELLKIKEFNLFKNKLYYEPPVQGQKEHPVYLTDIFTTIPQGYNTDLINPWLFSGSMLVLMNLPAVQAGDTENRKQQVGEWLKKYKQSANWQQDWDTILAPVYQIKREALPKDAIQFFGSQAGLSFGSRQLFSVLVHARVGMVTQRLYAILFMEKHDDKQKTVYDSTIKKIFWI